MAMYLLCPAFSVGKRAAGKTDRSLDLIFKDCGPRSLSRWPAIYGMVNDDSYRVKADEENEEFSVAPFDSAKGRTLLIKDDVTHDERVIRGRRLRGKHDLVAFSQVLSPSSS